MCFFSTSICFKVSWEVLLTQLIDLLDYLCVLVCLVEMKLVSLAMKVCFNSFEVVCSDLKI